MNVSVPPTAAHWAAKLTMHPARLLHHSIPAALARRTPTEAIETPEIGSEAPKQIRSDLSPPIEPTAHGPQHNPVVTGDSVTDFGRVNYVADPFLMPAQNQWHVFFEVYNKLREPTAVIAHATSENGRDWQYDGIVLQEQVHLSFPYLFKWDSEYYMIPDQQRQADESRVTLYRAASFPSTWEAVIDIVRPRRRTSDSVIVRWNDRWWCLVGHEPSGSLYCYHSDELEAKNWQPHPENPVVSDRPEASRPAGRPLPMPTGILMFYQDCSDRYGERVSANLIDQLTTQTFSEQAFQDRPVIEGDSMIGWNSGRMHHMDLWALDDRFVCVVDGDISLGRNTWASAQWSLGVYSWRRPLPKNSGTP